MHLLGGGGLKHRNLKTALRNADEEIQRTQEAIFDATGVRPCFFRPPYGILELRMLRVCLAHRLTLALWSLNAEECGESLEAIRVRTGSIGNGDIVLMHDDCEQAPHVVSELITAPPMEGRRFVTLRTLIALDKSFG